jgi:NADP-dependent 3-hydroxy acid dehydrogenase YdfG
MKGERRTAVVTGASSGVGAAIAEAFGKLGWSVAIGARRAERLEETARGIESAGGRAVPAHLDVTRADSIEEFFATAEGALGPIDIVVNNAGIGVPGRIHELSINEIESELATNLLGSMLITRRALPSMIERRSGDVLFISSMNSVSPRPFQAGYTAAKAGVEGFAAALRMDLEGTGVRAITLRLGPTRSEFGYSWNTDTMVQVLESWQRWGFLRHHDMLDTAQVAHAVVAAVTAPRGMQLDVIQVNPEAPVTR